MNNLKDSISQKQRYNPLTIAKRLYVFMTQYGWGFTFITNGIHISTRKWAIEVCPHGRRPCGWKQYLAPISVGVVMNGWIISIYRPHGCGWKWRFNVYQNVWRKSKEPSPPHVDWRKSKVKAK